MSNSVRKKTGESWFVTIDFSNNRLPVGVTISSFTLAAVDDTGASANVFDDNSKTNTTNSIKFKILGGTNNKVYKITATITLSDGSIFKETLLLNVKDE